MRVTIKYVGPLAAEAGTAVEILAVSEGLSLAEVLAQAAANRSGGFRRLLLDRGGAVQPHLIVSVDGRSVPPGEAPFALGDGSEVVLALSVSGG